MATGVIHQRVALITLGTTGVLGVLVTIGGAPDVAIGMIAGATSGALITPDIDQEGRTREEQRLYDIPLIGPFVGWVWQWFWYGYAIIFRHRGVSHTLVIGTFTRILYLVGASLLVWFGVLGLIEIIGGARQIKLPTLPSWEFSLAFILFWIIQDWMHWTFDRKHPYRWLAGYGCVLCVVIWFMR